MGGVRSGQTLTVTAGYSSRSDNVWKTNFAEMAKKAAHWGATAEAATEGPVGAPEPSRTRCQTAS